MDYIKMKLSHFKFDLPDELLAQHPADFRDESRLMVLHRDTQTIEHKKFKDLIDYVDDGDLMLMNNTKVFPARLIGTKEKTGARIEVFLLRELNQENRLWDVIVDPARKIRIGNKLFFGDVDSDEGLVAEVIDNTTSRGRSLRFLFDGSHEEFISRVKKLGKTPLPRFINREPTEEDTERYQTIYAKHEGSVAAPTAGLHFSKHLLKRLQIKGVALEELTLHVGLGTFSTVQVEDLSKHKMDSEQIIISKETADNVNRVKDNKKRVFAVGTTVIRATESSVTANERLNPADKWTHKFIFPPYEFSIADAMITNFHTPQSTLMMMTAAFAGYDFLMKAYKEAVKEKYNFISYGDAMLIL